MFPEHIPSQGGFGLWCRREHGVGQLGAVGIRPYHQGAAVMHGTKTLLEQRWCAALLKLTRVLSQAKEEGVGGVGFLNYFFFLALELCMFCGL